MIRTLRLTSTKATRIANRSFITYNIPLLENQKREAQSQTNDDLIKHALELANIQESINSTSSSLYTPRDPLTITSNRELIQQRIESIAQKLEEQRIREEEKLRVMIEKEYEELMRPKISDYKRPITTFFLLASATYLSIQYLWWSMEGEGIIESKEVEIRDLERKIQGLLDEQRQIVNGEYINSSDKSGDVGKRRWFSLWKRS